MLLFYVTEANCGQEVKVLAWKLEIEFRMNLNTLPNCKVSVNRVPVSSQPSGWEVSFLPALRKWRNRSRVAKVGKIL